MMGAAKKIAKEFVEEHQGWFELISDIIQPLIDARNKLLSQVRATNECNEFLKQRCRDAKSNVKNSVEVSKGKWIEMLVKIFSDMNMHPK